MEEISSSDIKSAEELIKLGKNIGDEMNPDVDVDNTNDDKLSISSIIELKKSEVKLKNTEEKKVEKKKLKFFDIKNVGIFGIFLMCIIASLITILISWFFIF